MTQHQCLTTIASIGEEIGFELGSKLTKKYQSAHPQDVHSYIIGRNIIDQILDQPGCVGIQFYNAYNETGEKTLVYVGLDENGKSLLQYTSINNEGMLTFEKGIVADRTDRGGGGFDSDDWNWEVD